MRKWILHICIPFILIVLLALILFGLLSSKYFLSESTYTIVSSKVSKPIRIVQLTDLHNSEFGENNCHLVEKVAAQQPALILITGDLLNQDDERTDIAASLIKGLKDVAPVYVSFGNHETGYERKYGADLRALYTEAGAKVLEYDWVTISVDNQPIRLGGLYGYCIPEKYKAESNEKECSFLNDFQATDDLTVLMCHLPTSWQRKGRLDDWDVDIVFSGHTHGGQIIIPGLGGLWAPDRGWFPGREQGLYWSENEEKVLVLSRGLGSHEKLPRLNNIPEILVAEIVPE